jgi:fluoride exporter
MNPLSHVLLLAAAGAVGTLLRAGCNAASMRMLGDSFPWGTLAVNVAGSFAFGAIYAVARSRAISTEQEVVLLVGLLGGFTTYSSYAFQSTEMLAHGRTAAALAYVAATNVLGMGAVWAGLRLFR